MNRETKPDVRLEGLAAAMLGDFVRASSLLEEAWKDNARRDPGAAAQARFEQIRLILREVRDYRRARSLLTHLRDLGDYQINGEMLLLELQVRTGELDAASQGWRKLQAESERLGHRRRATLIATGLALELAPRVAFDHLLEVLADVRPAGARLPLLAPFRIFEGTRPAPSRASRRLREVLPLPDRNHPDFILRALLLSDALRYAGDRDGAVGMLKDAFKMASPNEILRRQVVLALMRLDSAPDDQELLAYVKRAVEVTEGELAAIVSIEVIEWWIRQRKFDLGGAILSWSPQPGSQYRLRYLIAAARLLQADGRSSSASSLLGEARQTSERLGIQIKIELDRVQPGDVDFTSEHRLELWISAPRSLGALFQPADRPAIKRQYDLRGFPLWTDFPGPVPFALFSALQDRSAAIRQVTALLPILAETEMEITPNTDLRIEFDDEALAALPWEWALQSPYRIVYRSPRGRDPVKERLQWFVARLQQLDGIKREPTVAEIEKGEKKLGLMVDGWRGQQTRRGLHAASREAVVGIIKLSSEEERTSRLGSGAASLSIEQLYAARRIPTITFDPRRLTPDSIPKLLHRLRLLHICLPLTELHGLLQLGSAESSFNSGLSSSFLSGLDPEQPRPVLLLDPPMPPVSQFWAQQLVWRNVFARQLFESAPVDAVIAAGLVSEMEPYYNDLLSHVERQASVGELVRFLNLTYRDVAAALYTFDPEIPLA